MSAARTRRRPSQTQVRFQLARLRFRVRDRFGVLLLRVVQRVDGLRERVLDAATPLVFLLEQ